MTPGEIETAARKKYNAYGDSFWDSSELMGLIYAGQNELAMRAKVIERTFTTPTVALVQEYALPFFTIQIKRVTYDGYPLYPIDFKDDDMVTGGSSQTLDYGTPRYYILWNQSIFLRSIPSAVGEIRVFAAVAPQPVTLASELEVPVLFHHNIVDYLVREMFAKEREFSDMYRVYDERWERTISDAIKWTALKKRGDQAAVVKDYADDAKYPWWGPR